MQPIAPITSSLYQLNPGLDQKAGKKEPRLLSADIRQQSYSHYQKGPQGVSFASSKLYELDARFKMGDHLVDVEINVEQHVLASQSLKEDVLSRLPDEARERVEAALETGAFPESLSAENVSKRIFEFAMSRFEKFAGEAIDSPTVKEEYLSFIRPAVMNGFDEALSILGDLLDDDTKQLVETTRQKVNDQFDSFLGLDLVA